MPKRARQIEEPKAMEKASATGKVSNEGNDLWLDSPYASRFNVESAPKNRCVATTNLHRVNSHSTQMCCEWVERLPGVQSEPYGMRSLGYAAC